MRELRVGTGRILAVTVPLGVAAVAVAWILSQDGPVEVLTTGGPSPAATATQATPTVTVTAPPASPSSAQTVTVTLAPEPAAPAPRAAPQGTVEIVDFSNHIEYSPACAKVSLDVANRSDTAVDTVRVQFSNDLDSGVTIDLGWHEFNAGLPPFESQIYTLKVCDDRMAADEYGPAAIPGEYEWTWFE